MRDLALALIGIWRQKFTRKVALAGLIAALLAASGCGGDDEPASTTPTATAETETAPAPAETTPTETEKQPARTETTPGAETSPEAMPGGAGDEEPARTLALFTGRGGRITPRVIRVPAFISVQVELHSADGATYALRFGDTTITTGGELNSVSTTIDGLRPGEAIAGRAGGKGTDVHISATAEPGP